MMISRITRYPISLLSVVWTALYWWTRPLVKWVLRRTTRLCELQRVCYGEYRGASRSLGIEFSIDHSRTPELQKVGKYLDSRCQEQTLKTNIIHYAVFAIGRIKNINPKVHRRFSVLLEECLAQVWGYRQLMVQIESLRKETYDAGKEEHETKLLRLWDALMPQVPLEKRITKQWQDIGFQGEDPKTDFRGMGILGLDNLLFFAENHTNVARHILMHAQHPRYGYSYAIVGINITHMAYNFLKFGNAKTHFFNSCKGIPNVRAFHQFYSYLFFEFDQLWRHEKPRDIMEFNRVRNKFEVQVKEKLKDPMTLFKCNFILENI
ncbi:ELMO domain-containing protein 2 [Oratosquilla oratoria]|uniref:ELMO domain-containing protein 2 n=1 Tax=Oratosquilla oratoria TaxID=337810 RepID=UPI003F75A638